MPFVLLNLHYNIHEIKISGQCTDFLHSAYYKSVYQPQCLQPILRDKKSEQIMSFFSFMFNQKTFSKDVADKLSSSWMMLTWSVTLWDISAFHILTQQLDLLLNVVVCDILPWMKGNEAFLLHRQTSLGQPLKLKRCIFRLDILCPCCESEEEVSQVRTRCRISICLLIASW